MAKITLEYDTKDKTLVATMDGKVLSDIVGAYISNYKNRDGEEAHIELISAISNEEEGMYERHSICASTDKKEKFTFKKKDDKKKDDKKTDKKKTDDKEKDDAEAASVALSAKLGKQMHVIQVD